jgi:hypothetical protein
MVNEVREICIESVCKGVRSSERERLVEIPFHHQNMTAKPFFDIMRAIIAEIVCYTAHGLLATLASMIRMRVSFILDDSKPPQMV